MKPQRQGTWLCGQNAIFAKFATLILKKIKKFKQKNQKFLIFWSLNMKSLEKMLSEILIEKDITQQDLAEKLKVAPSQVSRWMNGNSSPRKKTMEKIRQLYQENSNKITA